MHQVKIGVVYLFSEAPNGVLDYSFLGTEDANAAAGFEGDNPEMRVLELGLRYRFR